MLFIISVKLVFLKIHQNKNVSDSKLLAIESGPPVFSPNLVMNIDMLFEYEICRQYIVISNVLNFAKEFTSLQ